MPATSNAAPQAQAGFPVAKIAIYAVLFQLAWFWRSLPDLLAQGALPDTDDFQRLAQVRAWMAGQGWFDVVNHRMDPPLGADMHWSRLVDLPIAGIVAFLDLFADPLLAERLAAIVWPTALLVATVFTLLAVCRRLDANVNPLLALLFTVTCVTALTEFMPGRLDHHGLQILLYGLMLLGLVSGDRWWGRLLVGAAAAASVSIGLDAILIILFLFAWLGLDWALGRDGDGRGLAGAAAGLVGAALPLYALNVAPSQWLVARCDANSVFYLAALLAVAAAFALLAAASVRLTLENARSTAFARLAAGGAAAALAGGLLVAAWPQCAAGPYGELPPELVERWLVNVSEARGLFQLVETSPELWSYGIGYSLLLLAVGGLVTALRMRERPQFLALYAVLVISILASVLQYRAMRIGIFASIPFCVVFTSIAAAWIRERFGGKFVSGALQAGVVVVVASPAWLAAGALLGARDDERGAIASPAIAAPSARADWREADPYILCNLQSDHAFLAGLEPGLVLSDINSGPAVVVFTNHHAVGGPYHRNARAILDMVDFFETDLETARRVAERRNPAYVAWCEPKEPLEPDAATADALAVHIARGSEPEWLERLSPAGERLHVFRLRLN